MKHEHDEPKLARDFARAGRTGRRAAGACRSDLPALERVAARYAVAMTPAHGRPDRSGPIPTIPSRGSSFRCARTGDAAGRERRSDRRRRAFAGRRHRASLSRPRAVQARPCLRGLLPLLFPPRDGRTRQGERALGRRLSRGDRLHPLAQRDLGSDPDRRRSLDAVAAAAGRDHGRSRRASITSRSSAFIPACRWPILRASATRWSRR